MISFSVNTMSQKRHSKKRKPCAAIDNSNAAQIATVLQPKPIVVKNSGISIKNNNDTNIAALILPNSSELQEPIQPTATMQQDESADQTEVDVATESQSIKAIEIDNTSKKNSETVYLEDNIPDKSYPVADTVNQIEDVQVNDISYVEPESPVDPNIPVITEADLSATDDRPPQEILKEYGFIDDDSDCKDDEVLSEGTTSIVDRLTADLPPNPYQPVSIEGMVSKQPVVPEEIANEEIFICHSNKVPCSPNGSYSISPTNLKECVTYQKAMEAVKKYEYDGVSIVLSENNLLCAIDIDHCIKDEEIDPCAWKIVKDLNSYAEISISGTGLHILVYCDNHLDWIRKKANALGKDIHLEIYFYKRQICFTGHALKGYEHIRRADKELEEIYNAYMAPSYKNSDDGVNSEPPPPMTAEEVLEHLRKDKNGAKFIQAIESGDISGFDTNDRSSIESSILWKLCFYTTDHGVIREILLNSRLRRDKWKTMRGNVTYLDGEIKKALEKCKKHYHPSKKNKQGTQQKKPLSLQAYEDNFSFDFQTLANVELNAIALSEFFGKTIKDVVCYSAVDKSFFIYNGIIWDASQQETVMAGMAKRFIKHCLSLCSLKIKTLENELKSGNDNDEKNAEKKAELEKAYALHNYYKSQSSFGARGKLIADVKNEIAVDHEQFDRDPYLLNLQNGTFNLNTCELQPHRSSDMLTMVAAANYDPNAECPRFLQFIDEVTLNRTEIKRYLQKACGYILTGKNELHCMVISYGKLCRNGKTTIFNALLRTLKDYGITCPVELITKPSGKGAGAPQPELTQLYKKRLVYFAEPEKINCTLQASLIKRITGGDNLRARNLFTNNFLEFKCTALMVLSCNNLPNINDLTLIKSDRIKIIPFDRHFKEGERDTSLDDQFSTPEAMSAILNWLIEGYKMYVSEGLKPFREMKSLLDAYEQGYDIYSQFIQESLRLRKDNDCSDPPDSTLKAVWETGKKWLKDNNYYVPTRRDFIFELKKSGVQIYRKNNQDYIQGFVLNIEGAFHTEYKDSAELRRQNSNDSWHKPPHMQ